MSEKSPGRKKAKPSVAREAGAKYVASADFKATCLELMDKVKTTGGEYVITKHGKPVAKLVPVSAPQKKSRLWGSMKGTLLKYERPFDPIDGEYDIHRE
jgi:prevent-host-death family protein